MSLPIPAGSATPRENEVLDAARNWIDIKSGHKLSELKVTLASGAASLSGRLELSEGKQAAPGLFVYLLPAEREKAKDVWRFFVASVR